MAAKKCTKSSPKRAKKTGAKKTGATKKRAPNAWNLAVAAARAQLGVTGFVAIKEGTPLYKLAKEIHGKYKAKCAPCSPSVRAAILSPKKKSSPKKRAVKRVKKAVSPSSAMSD